MKPSKAVILIPIYKDVLNENEKLSLKQCFSVLHSHKIILVAPHEINTTEYINLIGATNCDFEYFSGEYFLDIRGYNSLLTARIFYDRFKKFDFMLIYQLDAFVFRDELDKWMRFDNDYIGAPWFDGLNNPSLENKFAGVGNGGFSLRRISTASKILSRIERIKKLRIFWFSSKLQSVLRFNSLLRFLYSDFRIPKGAQLADIFPSSYMNEDRYWTLVVAAFFFRYKIASVENARQFAFEVNPSYLYHLNKNILPFGCHAWEKYEPEFWRTFISDLP